MPFSNSAAHYYNYVADADGNIKPETGLAPIEITEKGIELVFSSTGQRKVIEAKLEWINPIDGKVDNYIGAYNFFSDGKKADVLPGRYRFSILLSPASSIKAGESAKGEIKYN